MYGTQKTNLNSITQKLKGKNIYIDGHEKNTGK